MAHLRSGGSTTQDTAQDLVSEQQGNPEFVVPLDGRVGYLRVRRAGKICRVELDDQTVGELPRATVRKPWHEFVLEREGHSFVVVSCSPDGPPMAALPVPTFEVFADGINLHDGRTLDQWRSAAPGPRDPVGLLFSNGLPRSPGLRIMVLGWVVLIALAGVPILLTGQPRPVFVWAGIAGWFGLNVLTQRWALRHPDLSDRLHFSIVLAALAFPFLLIIALLWLGGASGPAH